MPIPLHPAFVHMPLALAFLMPILVVVFAFGIRFKKWPLQTWFVIMGLQLTLTVSGYVALETGETDEEAVEKVISKEYIHEHEEAAEIFVGSTVLSLALSAVIYFLKTELQFPLQIALTVIGLVSAGLGYRTGEMGGDIAYDYGGAAAHFKEHPSKKLLPTPEELKTSSKDPSQINESLNVDENDYGNGDSPDVDDESSKVED